VLSEEVAPGKEKIIGGRLIRIFRFIRGYINHGFHGFDGDKG
jgi:hypothetical protein